MAETEPDTYGVIHKDGEREREKEREGEGEREREREIFYYCLVSHT